MPQAVTHILIPILIVAIFRDFYLKKKDKKSFPLHYVLIAGLGGILVDIDIIISVLFYFIGAENWNVHKTFTHSLFFPIFLFVLFLVLRPAHAKAKICNIGRHKLKLRVIFLMLALGSLIHIILDSFFGEQAFFLYPFSSVDYGINLFGYLPESLQGLAAPLLDGVLLVIWILYLELKHKISDFI